MKNGVVASQMSDILGCKWSLSVLGEVYKGVSRPGQLERAIAGISTKVLNERLKKLVRYGLLQRTEYAELPPRVEYGFTPFGEQMFAVLQQIEQLEQTLPSGESGR